MEEQAHEKWTIDVLDKPDASDDQPPGLLTRRNVLGLSCAAIAMLVLQACGGGGGGGGGGTPDEGDFFRATNVSVKDEVVVVPNDGTVTVSNLTANALTLSGAVPALVVGSIIVSGIGAGIMRKVTAVTVNGADTVLETVDAPFTDVFNSADVEFRKEVTADHVEEVHTHIDGVQVEVNKSRGRSRAATTFPITVPKTFVGEQTGADKVGVEIEANGAVAVVITGSINITAANGLERLALIAVVAWSGSYKFAILGETEFAKKEIPYATFVFNPIPIGAIGPVPILIVPAMHINLAAGGAFQGGWETTGNGVASYGMGFSYIQAPLGAPFSLAQLHPLSTHTHTGTFTASNFYASLKYEAAGWQPELIMSINGLLGPTFKGDIPSVAVELKANQATKTVDFTSDAIFRGRVGAEAGLLGFAEWPLFEVTLVEHKIPIKYHTFKPGDGNVGIS